MKREPPIFADCPDCGGGGYYMGAVCCGNALPSGECCGNPVGGLVTCEACGGAGRYPVKPKEREMTKVPYEHVVPAREITLPAETMNVTMPMTVPERIVKIPEQIVRGEVDVPGTTPGPVIVSKIAYDLPKGVAIDAEWAKAIVSGRVVMLEDADYRPKDMLWLPESGLVVQGSGVSRNLNDPLGAVFKANFAGNYTWHGDTYRKPVFKSQNDRMLTATLRDFGVIAENSQQDLFHFDGLGNGANIGMLRTRGGLRHFLLRSPQSREPGYIAPISAFADGYARCFLEAIGGGDGFNNGPTYIALRDCDVQTTNGEAHVIIQNAQPNANHLVIEGGIYHGGSKCFLKLINCPDLVVSFLCASCLVNTLIECDSKSNVSIMGDAVERGGQSGGYKVKKLNPNGSVNEAASVRF